MKVHFFERKINRDVMSIEKLFAAIAYSLELKGVQVKHFENPYPLSKIWKAMWFFKRNQGEINHITGDIHWASLLLNPQKTVLTIHDLVGMHQYNGLKKHLYFLLWVYLPIKKLKYITVISEKTKKEIVNLIPEAEEKIFVIPNGLTIDILPINDKKHEEIKSLLVVGTRANKNIDRIIDAVKKLDLEIHIVGKLTTSQLEKLNQHKITLHNYINISDEELIRLYDKCNILCFVSLYEGFGMPIIEAQARNCLVITSNISPMIEVAGNGALFVNPEDTVEISKALKTLMNEKITRNKLLTSGHENVLKYSMDSVTDCYLDVYKKILHK